MTTRTADGVEVLRDRRRVFSPDVRYEVPSQVEAKFRQQRILDHTNHAPLDTLLPSRPTYVPKIPESAKSRAIREKTRVGIDAPVHATLLRRRSSQEHLKKFDVASDAEEMTALLLRLNLDNVAALHDVEGGSRRMSQDEFLATVVDNIQSTVSMATTVTQLCHLFHKIDHDEDGVITWTEFTSFVLETMRGYSEQLLVDGLHEYNKTAISTPIVVNRGMEKLIEANDSQCFLGFEQHSKVFQVFDARRHGHVVGVSAPCTGGHLVDITTVPPWDYIVGSTTSTTINFWDGRDYALRQQLPTTEVQTVVRWNDQHKLLYSASTTGLVRAWNCETLECMGTVNLKTKHSVTDMTFLSPRANAVVASLAPTISILDISTNKLLNLLAGHRLGVTCVKYSLAYRYIISAGLDHDVRLWNPYVESSIATLIGHRHQVVGLTWVDDSPEVHSVDEAGFLKIWDLRTYRCIQTLSTLDGPKPLTSASSNHKPTSAMVHLPDLNRIVLASSRVEFHDAVLWNASDENALEKETPSMALFMPSTLTILTTAGRHVRVWNAQTGQLTYNLRALVPATISAGCYGPGSVGFLGTQAGTIYCLNVVSGTLVRSRPVHSREVSAIALVEFRDRSVAQRVVSASLDGTCVVSDADTLAPLNSMNHWHGLNGHPTTRVAAADVLPPHDYFVPQPTKAMYSDYALDCLKRIFATFDPQKTGETSFTHVAALFDAVVSLNHRSCQRNQLYLTKLVAAAKRPATLPFLDFLLMVHETWHGLGYATSDIGCVAVSHKYNVIVTASMDGHFCVWHGSKCQPLASSPHSTGDSVGITAVVFLEPHPIFAVANDHGGLELFAIPPHPLRYECIFRTSSAATVHSIAWCLPRTLVTGDDEGNVTTWRIDGLFEHTADDEPTAISDSRRSALQLMQSTRNITTTTRRRRRRSTHQYEYTLEGQVSVDATWPAHVDALCSLHPCNGSNQVASHLVTCGWDGFVRVWALFEERLVGTLIRGPQDNPNLDDNVAWGLTFRHAGANSKVDVRAEAARFLMRPPIASLPSPSNRPAIVKCDPADGKTLMRPMRRKLHSAGTVRRLPSDKRSWDDKTLFNDGEFVVSPLGTRYAMRLQEALDSLEPTAGRPQEEKKVDPRIQRIQLALQVLQPARSHRQLRIPTDEDAGGVAVRSGELTTDQHS